LDFCHPTTIERLFCNANCCLTYFRNCENGGWERIVLLALAGAYLAGSALLWLFFRSGPVADCGAPVLALVLAGVFIVRGQDLDLPEP
jgi:hypothetical protein